MCKICRRVCWALVVLTFSAAAQTARPTPATSSALPSGADRQADELVSLSADKILEIMQDSPGLLLEFKRTLVHKAYEQGRILNPESLTDEAVFDLIRNDDHIRVLATQEIVKRDYVRAKPTQEELAKERWQRERWQPSPDMPAATTTGTPRQKGQTTTQGDNNTKVAAKDWQTEQDYWQQRDELDRERALQRGNTQDNQGVPADQYPAYPNQPQVPEQQTTPLDRNREMQRADAQPPAEYDYPMTPISPSELPGLFAGAGTMQGDTGSLQGGTLPNGVRPAAINTRESARFGATMPMITPPSDTVPPPSSYPTESASLSRQRARILGLQPNYAPPVIRHRPDPYANVPSLYDLYSQVSKVAAPPQRFGADIFTNGSGNFDNLPMDLPAGPDYVLGPGDTVRIDLWGSVSDRLQRVVDREGQVSLPEAGTVQVTGKTLGQVQELVQGVLRTQYRDVRADVSLARIRTVRVYVVGDVAYPGAYDISALSTPLNAVLAAGGPTTRGSMRDVRHYRGKQLVDDSDLYDMILHGVRTDATLLQSGDTIQVPPIGPQITVEGMVRRPAIYELHGESNLADALDMAGGVLSTGTLRHIDVERVEAHEKKVMLSLDIPETNDHEATLRAMEGFKVQDGDIIRISPILPYSYKTVYLDGHVFHPGKYPYTDGMKVTDLIKSYGDLMPEPSRRHAEIIRLNPPDYRPEVLSFNLEDAMSGKTVPALKPFDTVRIFGRYDFEDPPEVVVTGEVRDPGEHLTNGETHLRDAIYLAGGPTIDAKLDDVQVYRKLPNGEVQMLSVNLAQALAGDPKEDILLDSKDRVIVHRDLAKLDPPSVIIEGQVAKPGKYPLADNMSAADLVRVAGGFKRGAYTESADLARYVVENGSRVLGEHQEIPIGKAMSGVPDTDVRLMDGDVLAIKQLANWSSVGASIIVKGEVAHPSVYGIEEGEKLSTVIERAGGFTTSAYPYGAVLERVQVKEFSEKSRQEMIRRIETSGGANISGDVTGQEQAALVQANLQQQQQVLSALKSQPASGRLVIHISPDIKRWKNTSADIEVRAGDALMIPKRPNFIIVSGQVYNSSAVTFTPGKSASWYLQQAGGPTSLADKKAIYVIRADGSVVGREGGSVGFWHGSVMSLKLQPGDMVVVPEKFIGGSSAWKEIMSIAQFASSMAIAARVATSF